MIINILFRILYLYGIRLNQVALLNFPFLKDKKYKKNN